MVMKLYGADTTNVQRAILPFFEAEVDVKKELELVKVDIIFSQDQRKPIFLSKQPFGQIPYLEDDDISLFESRAIARYIVEKYGMQALLGKSLQERAAVNQWVECEAHNLYPVAQPLVREILMARGFQRPVNQELVATGVAKLREVLGVYETHLAKQGKGRFLVGEEYSLADACHAPYMRWVGELTPEVVHDLPLVAAWKDAITSRPAFRKCLQLDWDSAPTLPLD